MRAYGAPEKVVDQVAASFERRAAEPTFLVHPDNVMAVQLFLAARTQWVVTALSTWSKAEIRRVGLDYLRVEATARLEGLGELGTDDFRRIRIMEAVALNAWATAA